MENEKQLKTVGVIGAGTMGRGIALSFIRYGFIVRLYDIETKILNDARKYIFEGLGKLVELGKLKDSELESRREKILLSYKLEDFKECSLIIESINENLKLKQNTICQIESLVKPETIIASNTSTLCIDDIAKKITGKERFLGLHFFNPAEILKLVEVIPGIFTEEKIVDETMKLIKVIGKIPIKCKDSPGFIVNRLVALFINEAIRLLDEEVASAGSIDNAVKLGLNHRIGPLELADLIGLDILNNILVNLYKEIGDRYKPADGIKRLVQDRKLGRKTREGFYRY